MDELNKLVAALERDFDAIAERCSQVEKKFDEVDREFTQLKHVRDWTGKALRAVRDVIEARNAVDAGVVPDDPEPPL